MQFHKLLPESSDLALDELLWALDDLSARDGRPYVLVNFIASADGRATFQGKSGALGNESDHAVFHGLREHADAILAGTGTLRVERYGRILGKAERRERRVARSLEPEPLACAVTRTGAVPLDIPLFSEPEARVVVFTGTEIDVTGVAAQTDVVVVPAAELTLAAVLQRLYADFGVRLLLCEGGPSLFGSLLHEGLVDELFLTVAPKLAGGGPAMPITAGPELAAPASLKPVWVLERQGSLFLRYSVG